MIDHDELWTNVIDGSIKMVSTNKKLRYPFSMFDSDGTKHQDIDDFLQFLHAINQIRERQMLVRRMKCMMSSFNKTGRNHDPKNFKA
jgi:hypothetical protein